jgi:predicted ABC-type transport system involved in lysophospholipase L1 biosynthesis ATPase subunit
MSSPIAPHRPPPLVLDAISVDVLDGARTRHVLDAVSVIVAAGEMVAVMGPSGAGKSTLLGVACGLVRPSAGSVRVFAEEPALARDQWCVGGHRPPRHLRRSLGLGHRPR